MSLLRVAQYGDTEASYSSSHRDIPAPPSRDAVGDGNRDTRTTT